MGRLGLECRRHTPPCRLKVSDHGYWCFAVGTATWARGYFHPPDDPQDDGPGYSDLAKYAGEPIHWLPEYDDLDRDWDWPGWQQALDALCAKHGGV